MLVFVHLIVHNGVVDKMLQISPLLYCSEVVVVLLYCYKVAPPKKVTLPQYYFIKQYYGKVTLGVYIIQHLKWFKYSTVLR